MKRKTIDFLKSLLYGYRLYLTVLFFFMIIMIFIGSGSFLAHHEYDKEIEELNKQKQFLQKEIEVDRKQLEELYTEEGKEKLGREAYYLKHDDEEVFIIEYDTIN